MSQLRPSLTQSVSWEKIVEQIHELLKAALLQLLQYDTLPIAEERQGTNDTLNWCLYQCIQSIELKYALSPVAHFGEENAQRKKPDFNWQWIDSTADPFSRRVFVVECKRLGMRTDLSREYVLNGMLRFILEEYGYSANEDLGTMIAYIQSGSSLDRILESVNKHARDRSVSPIPYPCLWNNNGLTVLQHQINRQLTPTLLTLEHYWVDLRQSYSSQASMD